MSIADRFLLDMEYDEGLALVPETNMNAWMEDPRPGPNLHANPDEAVIQARGRRRIPQTFSPDRVASNQVEQETDNTLYCDSPKTDTCYAIPTFRRYLASKRLQAFLNRTRTLQFT